MPRLGLFTEISAISTGFPKRPTRHGRERVRRRRRRVRLDGLWRRWTTLRTSERPPRRVRLPRRPRQLLPYLLRVVLLRFPELKGIAFGVVQPRESAVWIDFRINLNRDPGRA